MKKPKISLIIPTFNVGKRFLEECSRSIQGQTLPLSEFEVIIFDDGSYDETPLIAETLARQLPNAKFYRRNINEGLAAARNDAIRESSGKLIALLDADDLLEPNSLSETLEFMESNRKLRYSYSRHRVVNCNGKWAKDTPGYPYDPELLLHINYIGPIKCFEASLHHEIGGYDKELRFGEDWDHALKSSEVLRFDQIAQNPKYLYLYRIHGTNMTLDNQDKLVSFRSRIISNALSRRGIQGIAFLSHKTEDGYNYMDWREDGETSDNP